MTEQLAANSDPGMYRGMNCRELARAIFDAEVPEQIARQLPPQALHMVIKQNGLHSSTDLIEIATLEQCRLIMDFDVWHKDEFDEDAFWEWLKLTDEQSSLELLQKVIKFVDLKLIGVLIGRYVDTRVFQEPNEQPPGPGYFTPDKGFTWISIKTEDTDKHFFFARLLALIFETSAELFYQLLATPDVATESMLLEESYQERCKRLASEGVPEAEVAASVHKPLSLREAMEQLETGEKHASVEDVRSVEPLLFESRAARYFSLLIDEVRDREVLQGEFTYLLNAAVVFFGYDFTDQDLVLRVADKVKGAINLGIERLVQEKPSQSLAVVYDRLGLGGLYRLGLAFLFDLRSRARKFAIDELKALQSDRLAFATLAGMREALPEMPSWLEDDGSVEEGRQQESTYRPIETLRALEMLKALLERLLSAPRG